MTRSADHFDGFRSHTQLKHLILESYFRVWARKLLKWGGAGPRVYYIDACAGRGMDDAGNHGSPVLAASEAAAVEHQFREQFQREVEVHVVAIEKRASHYRALVENLGPFGNHARALRGTLPDHLDQLEREMAGAPVLVFIDPFGVEPLRADMIRRVLARNHSEVFVLFADPAILRHFGVAAADEPEQEASPTLFDDLAADPRSAERLSSADDGFDATREACVAIMDSAFGGHHWYDAMLEARPSNRRQVALELYQQMLYDAEARYVVRIPIRDETNRHVYHLFYATKSAKGHRAMKEAVASALAHGPVQGSAAATIRLLLRTDLAAVERHVLTRHVGQRLHWTSDSAGRGLKHYLLEETPIFPTELSALQQRLARFRVPGRRVTYQFPDALPH